VPAPVPPGASLSYIREGNPWDPVSCGGVGDPCPAPPPCRAMPDALPTPVPQCP